ncbi:MAG: type I-MYXAN CRISPR-associated protein Cas6/Cmx6 [Thiogranum sp.]|nr:type I-MYXAN CRISPR-associated protein Cas6/Cmx6 [Thiogranum sp.]
MYWEEEKQDSGAYIVPDDVVDMVYNIRCRSLPLDHAWSFSTAVAGALTWINDEEQAGIHLIHGAESGNGWMRPEDPENQLLHLSHRSRMTLRVPRHRIDDAHKLTGEVLDIDGHRLEVGKAKVKLFATLPTQFARYVVVPQEVGPDDEEAFMAYAAAEIRSLGIRVRKLLCGRAHRIQHPRGDLHTRSVMLADLEVEEAVTLQQQGIGQHKKMGCGLFIPHKGIKAVHETTADKKA